MYICMLYRLYQEKINIGRDDKIKTVVGNICILLLVGYVKRLLKRIVKKLRNLRNIILKDRNYTLFSDNTGQNLFPLELTATLSCLQSACNPL